MTSSHTVSLENFHLEKRPRINSPKSIEALQRVGYDLEELIPLDMKAYKLKHPEVLSLPENIVQSRYDYYEKRRQMKLDEALKERDNVTHDEKFMNRLSKSQVTINVNHETQSALGEKNSATLPMMTTSTAINNEIKQFERIKKKQEMELVSMIQNELLAEMQRKENEEKIQKQLEKLDMLQRIKENKRKADVEKQLQIARDKELKEREAEEERKKNDLKKYLKEQKFMKEEQEKQRQREINKKLKQERDAKQQELLRQKTEAIFKEQQKTLEEKQKFMQERDEERRETLEKKRIQQLVLNKEKQDRQQHQIYLTMKNLEEKLHKQELDYNFKQLKKDERLKHFEYLREVAFKNNKEKSMKKSEEILRVIEKNAEKEREKVENYNKKQEELAKRKVILDENSKIEQLKKQEQNRLQEMKIHDVIKHNEDLLEERKSTIIFKIQKTEAIKNHINQLKERKNMEKSEQSNIKKNEKTEAVQKKAKIQEYELRKFKEQLDEKAYRIEEFKSQKSVLQQKKNSMKSEITKKKDEYLKKFNELMKKNQIKDITVEVLSDLFPGNTEIIRMFEDMKNGLLTSKKSGKSFSSSKYDFSKTKDSMPTITEPSKTQPVVRETNESNFEEKKVEKTATNANHQKKKTNSQNHKSTESKGNLRASYYSNYSSNNQLTTSHNQKKSSQVSDIDKKVTEYKVQLNDELLRIIQSEKDKELEREKSLQTLVDTEEKNRLVKRFGMERAQASVNIVKFNKEMERKIKEYERNLYRTIN